MEATTTAITAEIITLLAHCIMNRKKDCKMVVKIFKK